MRGVVCFAGYGPDSGTKELETHSSYTTTHQSEPGPTEVGLPVTKHNFCHITIFNHRPRPREYTHAVGLHTNVPFSVFEANWYIGDGDTTK